MPNPKLAYDDLNIMDLLKHIENKTEGPKRISIDPAKITSDASLEAVQAAGGVQ